MRGLSQGARQCGGEEFQAACKLCDTDAGKLAVVARAVREDEDYAVDTAMATAHTPGQPAAVTQTDVTPTGP